MAEKGHGVGSHRSRIVTAKRTTQVDVCQDFCRRFNGTLSKALPETTARDEGLPENPGHPERFSVHWEKACLGAECCAAAKVAHLCVMTLTDICANEIYPANARSTREAICFLGVAVCLSARWRMK